MITQDQVKQKFIYRNGKLYDRKTKRVRGSKINTGYIRVVINGKQYLAHQIIYLYIRGYIPECIDHINRNPADNRICNLRDVPQRINVLNRTKLNKNNKTGYCGVSAYRDKFAAYITKNGKRVRIGIYNTAEEASSAYNVERVILIREAGYYD
jgi:hypothetical protein